MSPYAFGYDNAVRYNDPNERCSDCPLPAPTLAAVWEEATQIAQVFGQYALPAAAVVTVGLVAWKLGEVSANAGYTNRASLTYDGDGPYAWVSPTHPLRPNAPVTSVKDANGRVNSTPVNGTGKYDHLKEPKKVGPGLETTRSQRARILAENKKQNGGQLTSDESGKPLNPPSNTPKGGRADMAQAEVDHVDPRSKGGTNSNTNQRVISKRENLAKSDK